MKYVAASLVLLVLAGSTTSDRQTAGTAPSKRVVRPADAERILDYHSDIVVKDDGTLAVTETIEVLALGREIRRGIYRNFPTGSGSSGEGEERDFEIVEVLRDGKAEPFHTVELGSYAKVYIGKADIFLDPGEYTYTLSYLSTRGLSPRGPEEELYWNVNGTGWQFSMERVSAAVTLPEGIDPGTVIREGYTGKKREQGADYRSWIDEEGRIRFEATRPLLPGESLTVLLRWPRKDVTGARKEIDTVRETPK